MPRLELATFNLDGLATGAGDERTILQALALKEADADVLALQGIASFARLKAFSRGALDEVGCACPHQLVIDGNDDLTGHLGVIGRLPLVHARSHQALTFAESRCTPPAGLGPDAPVFARDCLEVDVEQQGCRLTLFVCHFTAAGEGGAECGGHGPDRDRRQAEAAALRRIIERRFADPAAAEWVVLGDLGEQAVDDAGRLDPNSSLAPILAGDFAHDLLAAAVDAAADRWTFHDPRSGRYLRRDYVLLSPALARRNRHARPRIIRTGLPHRAERHAGPRLPRIGWAVPAASNHCPVTVELAFTGNPAG